MEYLMSYGWAILVIMIVGAALWQLGIFNMGGNVAPTMSGFQALKPLLATCKLGTSIYGFPAARGFSCQFVNNAGTRIVIKDMNFSVNGKSCNHNYIDINPDSANPTAIQLYRLCNTKNFDCPLFMCWDLNLGASCLGTTWVPIEKDRQFTASVFDNGFSVYCQTIKTGDPYTVAVDVTYDTAGIGVASTKRSTGTIHMIAD
jgi:hypothetical protein